MSVSGWRAPAPAWHRLGGDVLGVRDRGWLAFDVDVRQPGEPPGQVPVTVAEELHRGGDDDRADNRGVDEQGDRDAKAHLLEGDELTGGEAGEDDDDDQRRAGDQPRRGADAVDDAVAGAAGQGVALADAAEQEDLVVHAEPEQDAEQKDRDPRIDALDLPETEDVGAHALDETP